MKTICQRFYSNSVSLFFDNIWPDKDCYVAVWDLQHWAFHESNNSIAEQHVNSFNTACIIPMNTVLASAAGRANSPFRMMHQVLLSPCGYTRECPDCYSHMDTLSKQVLMLKLSNHGEFLSNFYQWVWKNNGVVIALSGVNVSLYKFFK